MDSEGKGDSARLALIPILSSSVVPVDTLLRSSVSERTADDPVLLRLLHHHADISKPPDNWLKSNSEWRRHIKQFLHSQNTSGDDEFGPESFRLANDCLDCLPDVDVVSSAESLKALLRMPYSPGQGLSMVIHRVGSTFLIDSFDAYAYLLDVQNKDWPWLQKWLSDMAEEDRRHAMRLVAATARSKARNNRKEIKERDMLSKFLYHSIDEVNCYAMQIPLALEDGGSGVLPLQTTEVAQASDSSDSRDITLTAKVNSAAGPLIPTLPKSSFRKNVLWTLDDIRLLIGTDLPIFSTGTYPCFTLRLCDMNRPVSVITGLDCWLDNLMSNVPELLMCFHINGIVQKYEVFKTEDLPTISDEARFSPGVVQQFAQSILSFLRARATKEGHTYWLVKEPDLDVVKLYDLTSLCVGLMESVDDNPFALPLSVLLCRLAHRILESPDSTREQILENVPRLLTSCLALVDQQRYPWLYSLVHFMQFKTSIRVGKAVDQECHEEGSTTEPEPIESTIISNIQHIAHGLTCLVPPTSTSTEISSLPVLSAQPVLAVQWTSAQSMTMLSELLTGAVQWLLQLGSLHFAKLLQSNASTSITIAAIWRELQLAGRCLTALRASLDNTTAHTAFESRLIRIVADCLTNFAHLPKSGSLADKSRVATGWDDEIERAISTSCDQILTSSEKSMDLLLHPNLMAVLFNSGPNFSDWTQTERCEKAVALYKTAFHLASEVAGQNLGVDRLMVIAKRLANAYVELGNALVQNAVEIVSSGIKADDRLEELKEKAINAFDEASSLFISFRPNPDFANIAIVASCKARLMRLLAHAYPGEAVSYLTKAASLYEEALAGGHLTNAPSKATTLRPLATSIYADLISVKLALADYADRSASIQSVGQGAEDSDRLLLKQLQETTALLSASGIANVKESEAAILRREAAIRIRMLHRMAVIDSQDDDSRFLYLFRLVESGLEKCSYRFFELGKFGDWSEAEAALADVLVKYGERVGGRKAFFTKLSSWLAHVLTKLRQFAASPLGGSSDDLHRGLKLAISLAVNKLSSLASDHSDQVSKSSAGSIAASAVQALLNRSIQSGDNDNSVLLSSSLLSSLERTVTELKFLPTTNVVSTSSK